MRTSTAHNHDHNTHGWHVLPALLINTKLFNARLIIGEFMKLLLGQVEGDVDPAVGIDLGLRLDTFVVLVNFGVVWGERLVQPPSE